MQTILYISCIVVIFIFSQGGTELQSVYGTIDQLGIKPGGGAMICLPKRGNLVSYIQDLERCDTCIKMYATVVPHGRVVHAFNWMGRVR